MSQSAAFDKAYADIITSDPGGAIRAEAVRLVKELEWFTTKAWNVIQVWAHNPEITRCVYLGAATGRELFARYVIVDVYYAVMRLAKLNTEDE